MLKEKSGTKKILQLQFGLVNYMEGASNKEINKDQDFKVKLFLKHPSKSAVFMVYPLNNAANLLCFSQ